MTHRKLLIVTFHFPPCAASGTFRMLGFARHLPKFGWDSIVVAPPSVHWEPQDEGLRSQVPAETILYPTPIPRGLFWKALGRIDGNAGWLLKAARSCLKAIREHRPDAVLTTGPPHMTHAVGLSLKRLGAGRAVLALAESDGDLAWALRESGIPHRIAAPKDSSAIKRAIVELASEIRNRRGDADRDGPHPFTRQNTTRQLVAILNRCLAKGDSSREPEPTAGHEDAGRVTEMAAQI